MDLLLRKATYDDCEILYKWANDPVVRKAAFHTERISHDEHVKWFNRIMADKCTFQYMLCIKDSLEPVAQIRLFVEEGRALISYSVSAEYRGMGIGAKMINMAEKVLVSEDIGVEYFVAQVKYDNNFSAKIFEKSGYESSKKENYIEYTKGVSTLIIRADGNETVGLGHIMRCLSIADAAKEKGVRVRFVVADKKPLSIVEDRGFKTTVLNTDYRNMESEQTIIRDVAKDICTNGKTVWLVDSYYMTEAYLNNLSQYGKVAVIDDMFLLDYPADYVINYNIYGDKLKDMGTKYPDKILLTGVSYAPVREQFILMRKSMAGKVNSFDGLKHILISTGGADSLHLAEKIAVELLEVFTDKSVILDIVCGVMNPNKEALLKIENDNPSKVKVHIGVKDMAGLMSECILAITAAGSTVYELSSLGIPFVIYYFVENQKLIAEYSEKIMGVVNAGDFSVDDSPMPIIVNEVKHLLEDEQYRQKIAASVYKTVDGNGAERIVDKIMLSLV